MDDVPGDRASECKGMMRPVGVWVKKGEAVQIQHKCEKCNFRRMAPVAKEDDRELLIKISVADPKSIKKKKARSHDDLRAELPTS